MILASGLALKLWQAAANLNFFSWKERGSVITRLSKRSVH
jgi:hypothetical protein